MKKQLLDSVLVISRKIKVEVEVISLSLQFRLTSHTETLMILDITKTTLIVYNLQHFKPERHFDAVENLPRQHCHFICEIKK